MKQLTYDPSVFDAADLGAAKRIILTGTPDIDSEARWRRETPYLAEILLEHLRLTEHDVVVDYGCGIGRLSKALIERVGCSVVAVDISAEMRSHAPLYVGSERFSVMSRPAFEAIVRRGFRSDKAFAAWVFQHCKVPADDIALLRSALPAGAPTIVVNQTRRCVPTREMGWVNDGQDIGQLLAQRLTQRAEIPLAADMIGADVARASFCRLYTAA